MASASLVEASFVVEEASRTLPFQQLTFQSGPFVQKTDDVAFDFSGDPEYKVFSSSKNTKCDTSAQFASSGRIF